MAAVGAGAGSVPDDAGLPWLVAIGSESERSAVLSAARGWGVGLRLKGYPAGHAQVADFPGPGVHLQAPNGRLLLSLPASTPDLSARVKAKLTEYDAAKDPGPGKPYPWSKPKPEPKPDPAPEPDPDGARPGCPKGAGWPAVVAIVILAILRRYLNRG